MPRSKNLGDAAHRAGEPGVLPRNLFHRVKHLALALRARKRLPAARAGAGGKAPSHDRQQHQGKARRAKKKIGARDRRAVEMKQDALHAMIFN
ncbi:MAG: hypothetical protein USCAAHI_01654 [Beijerinckiaceae bacterium]|nr:MAG: hypothetical protein USCAAHI_01654 [Beijerinckiaceae bacterium]